MRMQLKLGTHQEGVGWDCCRGADRCAPHRVSVFTWPHSVLSTAITSFSRHTLPSPHHMLPRYKGICLGPRDMWGTAPQCGCCLLAWRACVWMLRLGRRMELMGCRDVGDRHCPVAAQHTTSALSLTSVRDLRTKVCRVCEGSVRSPL